MAENLIGRKLGQYQITGTLGGGGMATVYRAFQEVMRRDVAVKVIKPALVGRSEFLQRFQREAQLVASLSHPHILKVFDFGHDAETDTVYLVMELLTGGSLADLIRKGPVAPETAARVLDQIAGALDYAHEQAVIHRDLKPQNVLLDAKGNAFLTDFGIAKILGDQTTLTHTGAAMGTPAYMAPEQWQAMPLDSRTDLYALGIMLYEILTGVLPFKGDTPASMMYMHLQQTPASVIQVRADLPPQVDAVIQKATAKQPDRRYNSATQMAEAFRAALAGPSKARPAHDLAAPDLDMDSDMTVTDLPPDSAIYSKVAQAPPSPLERLRRQLAAPTLSAEQQKALLFDLKNLLARAESAAEARTLLEAMSQRDDLFARIGEEIRDLLNLSAGKTEWQKLAAAPQPRPGVVDRLARYAPLLLFPFIVVVGVVLILALRQSPVPPLENAPFNIAVAGFVVDPSAQISEADAQVLSQAFYANLKTKLDERKAQLPYVVSVWSPAQVGPVRGATPQERERSAQAMIDDLKNRQNARADIVVYGVITRQNDGLDSKVAALPEFYLASNWPEVSEVFGRFALDAALSAPGPEQIRGLASELTSRAEILANIVIGVIQTINQQYDQARAAYTGALDVAVKASGGRAKGQELLYVLLGNTAIDAYNQVFAAGTPQQAVRLPALLEQAETDYTQAVKINPDYARSQIGLGVVLYLRASTAVAGRRAWNELDEAALNRIEQAFQAALAAADQPESADIPTKVDFGTGQVYLLRYLRGDRDALPIAEARFNQVIADYGDGKNPRVQELAAQALGMQGLVQRERGDFAAARAAYEAAVRLTQLDARKQVLRRNLLQVTLTERRSAGDTAGVAAAIEELLKLNMPPTEAAALLYQLAKMYSEHRQREQAVATYERALNLDLAADPALAAQLWAELGDKYYDQGRLAESIKAYEQALALDPARQAHLRRLIEQTLAEMNTNTAPMHVTDEPGSAPAGQ